MANSEIEIWNMALGACGSSQTISSPTENSPQANTCRRWYGEVRRFVNKQAPWGCALTWSRLAVLTERDFSQEWTVTDPGPGWRYAYSLPTGFLNAFYLQDFSKFELALHGGVPALMANSEKAILRYVVEQETVSYWDNGFTNAVVSLLAFRISPAVNAKLGQRDRLRDEAFEFINLARETAANSEELRYDALPEAIQARGYSGSATTERYFNTFADLNREAF